jgi:hypothetical protein
MRVVIFGKDFYLPRLAVSEPFRIIIILRQIPLFGAVVI